MTQVEEPWYVRATMRRQWFDHDTQGTATREDKKHHDFWCRYEGYCRRCEQWVPLVTWLEGRPEKCSPGVELLRKMSCRSGARGV